MIREAVIEDVDAIAAVHVAAWRETYPGIMPREILDGLGVGQRAAQWRRWFDPASEQPDRRVLTVCVHDGKVVGFASGAVPDEDDQAELQTLYLLKRAQGQGYGRHLIEDLAGRLATLGATSLMLWMADGNPTGGFYKHLGAVPTEIMAKPFGPYTVTERCYRRPDIGALTAPRDSRGGTH